MSDNFPKRKTLRRHHVRGAVVFITATTRRRQAFFAEATHAHCTVDSVWRVQTDGQARVIGFVVMPDHGLNPDLKVGPPGGAPGGTPPGVFDRDPTRAV